MKNLPATFPDGIRKSLLLRSIEYHTKQANRSVVELTELLTTEADDTLPLVITGQGEYAGVIEAKPGGKR